MSSEASVIVMAPPVFDGTNYEVWVVQIEAYLDANDQWEAIENAYEVPPLLDNPTIAQMKNHECKQRKSKAKANLFATVSSSIFTRIMTLKTTNEIWNFLKKEYEGNERVKGMQVLNLIREFEMQRMKESETIKDYYDRLLDIVNKVRLLGTDFYSRIVQKILVTVPEKFEAWYGYKPKFQNLKTFGCLCFSYIPQVKRDKLDKKTEPRIFVGYSSISKAYRISSTRQQSNC
jgi:hypothetical protein